MENPIKMDDLVFFPYFWKHPYKHVLLIPLPDWFLPVAHLSTLVAQSHGTNYLYEVALNYSKILDMSG